MTRLSARSASWRPMQPKAIRTQRGSDSRGASKRMPRCLQTIQVGTTRGREVASTKSAYVVSTSSKLDGLRRPERNTVEPIPLLLERRPQPVARPVPFVAHQCGHHLLGSLNGCQAVLEGVAQ